MERRQQAGDDGGELALHKGGVLARAAQVRGAHLLEQHQPVRHKRRHVREQPPLRRRRRRAQDSGRRLLRRGRQREQSREAESKVAADTELQAHRLEEGVIQLHPRSPSAAPRRLPRLARSERRAVGRRRWLCGGAHGVGDGMGEVREALALRLEPLKPGRYDPRFKHRCRAHELLLQAVLRPVRDHLCAIVVGRGRHAAAQARGRPRWVHRCARSGGCLTDDRGRDSTCSDGRAARSCN